MLEFFVEFFNFMKKRKKYWLIPIFIVFILLGALVFLTKGTAVAPFVYTLF